MTSMTMIQTPSLATHPTMRTGELDAVFWVFLGPAEMNAKVGWDKCLFSLLWSQTWNALRWGGVCHS